MELTTRRIDGRTDDGFTLVEVLVAMLIAMIGLMGTVAIQQTVLSSTQNANDAAIANRLAAQGVEELNVRSTLAPTLDLLAPVATGTWTAPIYLDQNGVRSATLTPAARFSRQIRVTNLGTNLPYNISVQVGYALDSGMPKAVQINVERRKSW